MPNRKQLIPSFEGNNPEALVFNLTGRIDEPDDQPDRALKLGEAVTMIVNGVVTAVNHTINPKEGDTTRSTKVKVDTAHLVDPVSAAELT